MADAETPTPAKRLGDLRETVWLSRWDLLVAALVLATTGIPSFYALIAGLVMNRSVQSVRRVVPRSKRVRARDKASHMCRWRVLAKAVIASILTLGSAHLAGAVDQTLIARARHTLYTNREGSLAILEDALRQNPDEVAYWVEYIHALGIDSDESFADRASRHALKLHPHHPDLLIARARVRGNGVALEALAELAKVPGYRREAERLTDLAVCGLFFPESEPWPAETFASLADRLVVIGRADDAARYIDEALNTISGERAQPLLARRAMLAALNGEFQRAMKLHILAHRTQVAMTDSYYGLADVLLAKNRPDLAIASLGDQLPADENLRRILAIAKSRTNDIQGALDLTVGNDLEDPLLRCRVLVLAGRVSDAKALGQQIVAPMAIPQGGSYAGPWREYFFKGPKAIVDDYLAVVRWLNDQFPEKRPAIEFMLGTGTEKWAIMPVGWSPSEPISQTINRLETAMRSTTSAENLEHVRTLLSNAYAEAGRYNAAAGVLTACRPTYESGIINYAWVQWSMLRRQAEALDASEKDYASLAVARPIIANVRGSRWSHPKVNGQPWLTDAEVVEKLVAIGPAVLADVMTQLAPNTISGEDRRPWVAVIEQLGSARDAPVLIATLAQVTRPASPGLDPPRPEQNRNDHLTAAAIERCLEKLTGAKPEGRDRAIAWSKWWAGNAAQIVAGKQAERGRTQY
jgi:hypothetical protein